MKFYEIAEVLRGMEFFSDSLRLMNLKAGREIIVAHGLQLNPKDIKEVVCTSDVALFISKNADDEDHLVQYDLEDQTIVSYIWDDKIMLHTIVNKIRKGQRLTDDERLFTEQNSVIDDFTSDLIIAIAEEKELGYND